MRAHAFDIVGTVGLTPSCQRRWLASVMGGASLRAADSALQAALSARDLEATTAFYADDAVIMPLAKPGATGRDAIRDEWAHNFGSPDFVNTMTLTAVVERGKWVNDPAFLTGSTN